MALLLNKEAAYKVAKELTEVAMNNGLIKASASSSETAKSVYTFYSTLFTKLTEQEGN